MKRYAPFASFGVLLALMLHAAVPAPPSAANDPPPETPFEDDSSDSVESDPGAFRSDEWLSRHSLVPRERIERTPSRIDGAVIHDEVGGSKRRK